MKSVRYLIMMFACLFGLFTMLHGQQLDTNTQYRNAIEYIRTHQTDIRNNWLRFFGKLKESRRFYEKFFMNSVEINVSPFICFQGLYIFRDNVTLDSVIQGHSTSELNEPYLYNDTYHFESYKSMIVEDLYKLTDSLNFERELFLNLSRPRNNYLRAELTRSPNRLSNCINLRVGEALLLLFVFDDANKVENVYFDFLYYN